MTKAVLFDLDGTLCNSLPDIVRSANLALAQLGFPGYGQEEYKRFIGSGVKKLISRMLAKYPHTETDETRLLELYMKIYSEHSLDETRPYDGVEELLGELRRRGISAAVVSNKPMADTRKVIGQLFPPECFAYVYGQTEPYRPKPDPAAVFHVLDKLGVNPEDCLFVGDSGVDMQTAENAGIFSVGALWGFRSREELLENHACAVCENAREIIPLLGR